MFLSMLSSCRDQRAIAEHGRCMCSDSRVDGAVQGQAQRRGQVVCACPCDLPAVTSVRFPRGLSSRSAAAAGGVCLRCQRSSMLSVGRYPRVRCIGSRAAC